MKNKSLTIPDIPTDRVLLLNITRSYNASPNNDPFYIRPNIYEMTRKYWKVDKSKAERADFVLGVANGIVVAVYTNTKWEYMDFKGSIRVGFCGEEVPDSIYLGLNLSQYMRVRNPIRYINF